MKKKVLKLVMIMLAGLHLMTAKAQDHVYSQFFRAPAYLNPSLTGQFDGDFRLNMIYRSQWTGLSSDLSYLTASIDLRIPSFGGGVALMFTRSSEGSAYLVKNNISGSYSYSVGHDHFVASFGIQGGITNRHIDWGELVFSDQIDTRTGLIPGRVSMAQLPDESQKNYFDVAGGLNLVYRNLMLGGAAYHINQPDESFIGTEAKLPMRLTAHLSWLVSLGKAYTYKEETINFIPSVVYNGQAKFNALSVGGEFQYRNVKGGLWYRTADRHQPAAAVISLVFDVLTGQQKTEKLSFGASHDATLSKIDYTNTNGSTEAAIGFQKYFRDSDSFNKFNSLRCYDFY